MSLYKNGPFRDELIARIRHKINLSESIISDKELIEKTEESVIFARIELNMSFQKFKKELKKELKNIIFKKKL